MKWVSPVLSLLLICSFSLAFDPDKGLILYLPLDEGKGDVAEDMSGNGNDGRIIGAEWTNGKFEGGLEFEPSDTLKVPHSESFGRLTKEITISMWVKPKKFAPVENRGIFKPNSFNLDLIRGVGRVEIHNAGRYHGCPGSKTVSLDEWHHIVGVYSESEGMMKYFVDGELQKACPLKGEIDVSQSDLIIGSTGWGPAIEGIWDEIRIYERALSEKEVKELYTYEPKAEQAVSPSKITLAITWGEIKSKGR